MSETKQLPLKQKEILNFIRMYIEENNYPPSVREIGAHVNIPSTSTVHKYLGQIESAGYLKRNKAISRAMILTDENNESSDILLESLLKPITGDSEKPFLSDFKNGLPFINFSDLSKASIEVNSFGSNEAYDKNLLWRIPEPMFENGEFFITEMPDGSMINRMINPGDKLIVKLQDHALNGDILLCSVNGKTYVRTFQKGLRQIRLQAEDEYTEAVVADEAEVSIYGVIKGFIRIA